MPVVVTDAPFRAVVPLTDSAFTPLTVLANTASPVTVNELPPPTTVPLAVTVVPTSVASPVSSTLSL